VGGAAAIGEHRAAGATYVNVVFGQIARNSRRVGMDTPVRLDLGEGCVGTKRVLQQRSRPGITRGYGQAGPRRVALPRHITQRRTDPQPPPRSGRGGGNSEIMNGGCAERALWNSSWRRRSGAILRGLPGARKKRPQAVKSSHLTHRRPGKIEEKRHSGDTAHELIAADRDLPISPKPP
jgi:hypothetical protein